MLWPSTLNHQRFTPTRHSAQRAQQVGDFLIHFGGLDDQATRIVILLITPDRKRHRHVTNLAAIARQLLCADVREAIVRARTADEALTALAGARP